MGYQNKSRKTREECDMKISFCCPSNLYLIHPMPHFMTIAESEKTYLLNEMGPISEQLEGILHRGEEVDFRNYMEQRGVLYRGSQEGNYLPSPMVGQWSNVIPR